MISPLLESQFLSAVSYVSDPSKAVLTSLLQPLLGASDRVGITDVENRSGEQLGRDRLLECAQLLPAGSAAETGQAMLDRVDKFRSAPPTDDETLIVLQPVAG